MRTIFLLFILSTAITAIACVDLTQEESTTLENVAWLFAQFSLVFDGDELPLNEYFLTPEGENHYKLFEEVEDFFSIKNLQQHFTHDMVEINYQLDKRIRWYQSLIIMSDALPVTFDAFYKLFELFKVQETLNSPGIDTFRRLWDDKTYMNNFCHAVKVNDFKQVKSKLKNFQLNNMFPDDADIDILKKQDVTHYKLSGEYFNTLKGHKEPKPSSYSLHHIIPSDTLVEFYKNYYKLLSAKSEKIEENHQINWIKIMEINTQKSMLVQSKKLWSFKPEATLPVKLNRQHDFIRSYYRCPPGLLFYGPNSSDRSDDPSDSKNKKKNNPNQKNKKGKNNEKSGDLRKDEKGKNNEKSLYGDLRDKEIDNDFEYFASHIIGTRYFNLVKKLNKDIFEFNKNFNSANDINDLHKKAMYLYNQIFTIHREYNNGQPIIYFSFNTNQWLRDTSGTSEKQFKWKINVDFNSDNVIYDSRLGQWIDMNDNSDDGPSIKLWQIKMEWREKALAQARDNLQLQAPSNHQTYLDLPTPNLMVPDLSHLSLADLNKNELKRRKRYPIFDPITYMKETFKKCFSTASAKAVTSLSTIKRDSCSYYLHTETPSIIAVPYWGLCKLFG